LGALAGVGDVKFDCKTATVTMKPDATLASEVAEKALKDAGFGMKSFAGGPPPGFVVVHAKLKSKDGTPIGDADSARIEQVLKNQLPSLRDVFVEFDGRLTALAKDDAKLEAADVESALRANVNVDVDALEKKSWPKTATAYVATLPASQAREACARGKARVAAESIDTVAGVVTQRDGALLVYTKEPCANLEAKLKQAFHDAGVELETVRTRG